MLGGVCLLLNINLMKLKYDCNVTIVDEKGRIQMAHCTNCNHKWKTKEILSLGFSKKGRNCLNCGNKQYISSKTQRIFALGYVSLIFIMAFPFFITLSDKDEPLW